MSSSRESDKLDVIERLLSYLCLRAIDAEAADALRDALRLLGGEGRRSEELVRALYHDVEERAAERLREVRDQPEGLDPTVASLANLAESSPKLRDALIERQCRILEIRPHGMDPHDQLVRAWCLGCRGLEPFRPGAALRRSLEAAGSRDRLRVRDVRRDPARAYLSVASLSGKVTAR